jgi:imidazolonepropionase-like amidohydrolase
MRVRQLGGVLGLWLLAMVGRAAAQAAPAAAPAQSVAIRASRVIIGDGSQLDNVTVVVTGERITAIGPTAQARVPSGARVIDLTGWTVMPGFFDMHTHIESIDNDGGDLSVLKETAAHGAIYGVINAKKTLEAGFTTIREAGSTDYVDVVLRDAINRGLIPGPRMHASGPAIGSTGGHADVNGWSPNLNIPGTGAIVDGVDGVRHQVRRNVKYGSDQIKMVATGGILSVGDAVTAPQFSHDEMRTIVEEATRLGRKVMAHAHGGAGLMAAVNAGVASIEHGSLVDDSAIVAMKARGTYLVPTLIILEEIVRDGEQKGVPANSIAKARAIGEERRRRLRRAYQSGVKFALGTDATSDIHGRNGEEFKYMVDILGATPMEAITIGTMNAATLLGVEREFGSVTVGKVADLVAVQGNPLTDVGLLARVGFVMKGGAVVKGAAR